MSRPIDYLFNLSRVQTSVFLIWLFHISAMIGISLGFEHWFIEKTPLNLGLMFILLIWVYPLRSAKAITFTLFLFISGMFVEWLGVNYSLLFGEYSYGENLGIKLGGVPLMIGINWAVLVYITAAIAKKISKSTIVRILFGSILMVGLDYLMEFTAPVLDFWEFTGGNAPLSNYIAWFGIAIFLHLCLHWIRIKGNFIFSIHLFLAQSLFFLFLYGRNL